MYLKITCIQDKLTLQLNLNARTAIMKRKKLTNNLLKKVKKNMGKCSQLERMPQYQ